MSTSDNRLGSQTSATAFNSQITDQNVELTTSKSPRNNFYSDSPYMRQFNAEGLDVLSWGSTAGLPFGQHGAQITTSSAFSQSMTLNFKSNSNAVRSAPSLDILNAESYNDGNQDNSSQVKGRGKRRLVMEDEGHPHLPFGVTKDSRTGDSSNSNTRRVSSEEHDGKRRKRTRVVDNSDEEDAASKKARGRPRLENKKDENAAEVSISVVNISSVNVYFFIYSTDIHGWNNQKKRKKKEKKKQHDEFL